MAEKSPLFGSSKTEEAPIYYDKTSSPAMKLVIGLFLGLVSLVLAVSLVMISIMSAVKNKLFVMLLISLIAFAQVEYFLVFFIHREKISKGWYWTIFLVGTFVIIECINTDIIIFTT